MNNQLSFLSVRKRTVVLNKPRDDSPDTKRMKKQAMRDIQNRAFKDLVLSLPERPSNSESQQEQQEKAERTKVQYGAVKRIVERYVKCGHENVNAANLRKHLEYRMKLYNEGKEQNSFVPIDYLEFNGNTSTTNHEQSTMSSLTGNNSPPATSPDNDQETEPPAAATTTDVGGRKKGATKQSKLQLEKKIKEVKTYITEEYDRLMNEAKKRGDGCRVARGTLKTLIDTAEQVHEIKPGTIKAKTIKTRITLNNFDGHNPTRVSPLHEIEPFIVQLCVQMARINNALTREDILLVVKEVISGTEHEKKYSDFIEKIKKTNNQSFIGWYNGFMKRHGDELKKKRCKIKDVKRHTWCTVEHFTNMYDCVYEAMVTAGVAEKTDVELMYDDTGNVTDDVSKMFGRPTKYRMVHPEYVLFVDETGCNTNQKQDGYVGGELFVVPVDFYEGGQMGSATDLHFTVLCFSSGTGAPVMCAIILKSELHVSKIPISWKYGIDIRRNINGGENTWELLQANSGPNNAMAGGPVCTYNGKNIHCFVGTSPNASISSELLVEMLRKIDEIGVYDRSTGILPFLLLDGHQSRMQLPFLEYINQVDHKWMVCIGVPYATHIWQVADAPELNGSFKIALTKAKREYLKYKPNNQTSFKPTDIVPLIGMAWNESFGIDTRAAKVIKRNGWGPSLTYNLLDHKDLINSAVAAAADQPSTTSTSTTVNSSGAKLNSMLDAMIESKLRSEAASEKYLREKELRQQQAGMINRLEGATRISSGELAVANHYQVMGDDVLECARNIQNKRDVEARMREERKAKAEIKSTQRFKQAFARYKSGQYLVREDLLALLKKVKIDGEEGNSKKTTAELRVLWETVKHRLDCFLFDGDDAPTTNNDTTGANFGEALAGTLTDEAGENIAI